MTDYFDGWMGTRVERYDALEGPRAAIIGIEADRQNGVVEVHRATHSADTLLEIIDGLRQLHAHLTGADPTGFDEIVAAGLGRAE